MRRILGMETSTATSVSPSLVLLMLWGIVACPASGQSTAPEPVPARSKIVIPPPRLFDRKDPTVSRIRLGASTSLPGLQETGATSLPTAAPLPAPPGAAESTPNSDSSSATPPPPPHLPVDTALIPGRVVEPIDLANALKLTGARELDIAIARQRILEAAADLTRARALWLPSLFYGPTWYRSDGQIQTVTGQVQTIDRSGAVRRRDGGAGQYDSRGPARDRYPFRQRHDFGAADLRCDLRTHGGSTCTRRE